jgi:hypothetical protein
MLYCSTESVNSFIEQYFLFSFYNWGQAMENTNNGKKQGVGRRCDQRLDQNQSEGLGAVGCNCPDYGTETQGEPSQSYSEGGYTLGSSILIGDTPSGKILQRLELVERSHKEYVRAHQTRLKARLDESENLEQLFDEAVTELRQEIYELATQVNQTNGNGHQ